MSKTIIIMGSSNPVGNTYKICKKIVDKHNIKFQDLNELVIMPYDYDYDNKDDDFLGFMEHVTKTYDHIILASPIYWYSVSGIMKNFIDRFTDLLTIRKEMGRLLREKKLSLVSVSNDGDCPEEFHLPLERTANYLAMEWLGHTHFASEGENVDELVSGLSC